MIIMALVITVAFSVFFAVIRIVGRVASERKAFERKKIIYRTAHGDISAINQEQRVYIKRARSLWGKETKEWSTFRIHFRPGLICSSFGFVVPDTFEIDPECLQELGFTLGFLDCLTDSVSIELPFVFKFLNKLNKWRAERIIVSIAKERPQAIAEFRNRKRRKVMFVAPMGESSGLWLPSTEK